MGLGVWTERQNTTISTDTNTSATQHHKATTPSRGGKQSPASPRGREGVASWRQRQQQEPLCELNDFLFLSSIKEVRRKCLRRAMSSAAVRCGAARRDSLAYDERREEAASESRCGLLSSCRGVVVVVVVVAAAVMGCVATHPLLHT
ncbi:hypothetical protein O3P69_011637 [Scylla paramamosain]|uniref:Uncharacterized protein n=1 Tax=Scylla paramamosain TaxID=85552 RepID=A0AAW0T7X1_SCYPA